MLGKREVHIYGSRSFEDYLTELVAEFSEIEIEYFQSNHEGELIDKLQQFGFEYDGIILNAAAYTHTSIALADTIAAIETPVFEVHISDIHAREDFRKHSYITEHCVGIITGQGLGGYRQALLYFKEGTA